MNFAAINHRPTLDYIYPIERNVLNVKFSCAKDDFKSVCLVWWFRCDESINKLRRINMKRSLKDLYNDYFEATINASTIAAYIRYYFVVDDGKKKYSFGANGFTKDEPLFNENFFEFLWPNPQDSDTSPTFAKDLIYYQIFPERFFNGDESLSPNNVSSWNTKPTKENFMGGDLIGILNKLDYIKELGVTCLYLTPIFKAPSNHKYDTVDYFEIDPSFGNKDILKKLVNAVHDKGMKIILDGVFNHCGYYHPFFQDVCKNGKNSKYADWFFVNDYPVSLDKRNYDCVGHYKWMPKINLKNIDACKYFIEVGKYWIKEFDIDGWRLDVADEIPAIFWSLFSYEIKNIKADALLLGETWGDAYKLVTSNRLDSAMNYLFKDATVSWLASKKINVSQFDHLINKMYSLYNNEVSKRLYNLLDSHDTKRFLFECNGDIKYLKLAVALQMFLPGCPAIFYGDEIGISGDNDPDCRKCMIWEEDNQNIDLLSWYKKLINIRKTNTVLIDGDFESILCLDNENIYGFKREFNNECIKVFINASNNSYDISSLIDLKEYECILQDGYITETAGNCTSLPACSVHIYKRKES